MRTQPQHAMTRMNVLFRRLEPQSVRVENGVLVVELRLSCNLHDQTLGQVVARMQASHVAFINTMIDSLRLGIYGLPPSVLEPLMQAKEKAQTEGEADRTFFNKPQNYMQVTQAALDANDACYAKLAMDDTWAAAKGDAATIAFGMRKAAEKCANEGRPKVAAALLVMAAQRAGVPQEHKDNVTHLLNASRRSVADLQPALEAAGLLLGTCGSEGMWKPTLVELCVRSGDRHMIARLAQLYGHQPSSLWHIQPLTEYADLPLDAYKEQPFFHQINSKFPGLQLISQEPYIFICQDFVSADECQKLINLFSFSVAKGKSATSEPQTERRTSTTVILNGDAEKEVAWLREKVAALVSVDTDQLQVTKTTRYEQGEFFRRHGDGVFGSEKKDWADRLLAGETAEQLSGPGEAAFLPNRFITVFLYLNDVVKGGRTTWKHNKNDLYDKVLPQMGKVLGKHIPESLSVRPQKTMELSVAPRRGMAVIHFPSTVKEYMCHPDPLAHHESEDAVDPKYILQQFIWSSRREEILEEVKRGFNVKTESIQRKNGFNVEMASIQEALYGPPTSYD